MQHVKRFKILTLFLYHNKKMARYGKYSKLSFANMHNVTYSEPTAESVIERVDQVHCNSLPLDSVSNFLH